jgi:hypothetical protein
VLRVNGTHLYFRVVITCLGTSKLDVYIVSSYETKKTIKTFIVYSLRVHQHHLFFQISPLLLSSSLRFHFPFEKSSNSPSWALSAILLLSITFGASLSCLTFISGGEGTECSTWSRVNGTSLIYPSSSRANVQYWFEHVSFL